MDKHQFEFLAARLRSKEPAITAARLVLLQAVAPAEAARTTGMSIQSLSRSLKSYRELDAEIRRLYGPKPSSAPKAP